ncbi:hypothetical protein K32_08340 [Kaistia sp. 32K]|uniref:glutathione S-transferase family protein n=1 Tax=Kaistia sp. 32K TaxID=2795690 RepID=UPI0019160CDD|nr:glutathione S-transferase [Kaistia sp. 32K]BCP52217.1 hypothetical protein K32_08340 [Kaistia sp. 32K]
MRLFHSPTSPYVRKVRVCAAELGLADRIELVPVTPSRLAPDPRLAAVNPLAQVPTLVLEDGTTITGSDVICQFLDSIAGDRLVPASGAARWRTLSLHGLANGVIETAQLYRFETGLRPEPLVWSDWTEAQLRKIRSGLAGMEQAIPELGDRIDLAAITFACAFAYLDHRVPALDWRSEQPVSAHWFAGFSSRPSMTATAPVNP